MILRIRLRRGRPIQRKQGKNRHVASAFASLLIPVALVAYVLGFWRLASDMGLAGEFGFTGVLSHWQVWIPMAVLAQWAASVLNRYARGGELRVPRAFSFPIIPARPPKNAVRPSKVSSR